MGTTSTIPENKERKRFYALYAKSLKNLELNNPNCDTLSTASSINYSTFTISKFIGFKRDKIEPNMRTSVKSMFDDCKPKPNKSTDSIKEKIEESKENSLNMIKYRSLNSIVMKKEKIISNISYDHIDSLDLSNVSYDPEDEFNLSFSDYYKRPKLVNDIQQIANSVTTQDLLSFTNDVYKWENSSEKFSIETINTTNINAKTKHSDPIRNKY